MKKKKQQQVKEQRQEQGMSLGDLLDSKLTQQLKELKRSKEQEIQKQKEEELAKKLFEAKQREKNKSFEELLDESNLDWKRFK